MNSPGWENSYLWCQGPKHCLASDSNCYAILTFLFSLFRHYEGTLMEFVLLHPCLTVFGGKENKLMIVGTRRFSNTPTQLKLNYYTCSCSSTEGCLQGYPWEAWPACGWAGGTWGRWRCPGWSGGSPSWCWSRALEHWSVRDNMLMACFMLWPLARHLLCKLELPRVMDLFNVLVNQSR